MTTTSGAIISSCEKYRYFLYRCWDPLLPQLTFMMLNPSKADAFSNDPTIRKCIGFSTKNGYGGIRVLNLFAFRTTYPKELKAAGYPVGPDSEEIYAEKIRPSDHVVFAWGANARGLQRADEMRAYFRQRDIIPWVLHELADGTPAHPLMLPYTCKLRQWV